MPSGDDALPWLGDYPFLGGALANLGAHMIGTFADMPTPSLGTQSGADGAVSGTAFSAASGRFTAADTGMTLQVIDTGASPPVVYSFTVTFVDATDLTISSSWVGTGTSALSWSLLGRGPSNAGLRYFASDTSVEYQSTGTVWLQVAASGSGLPYCFAVADQKNVLTATQTTFNFDPNNNGDHFVTNSPSTFDLATNGDGTRTPRILVDGIYIFWVFGQCSTSTTVPAAGSVAQVFPNNYAVEPIGPNGLDSFKHEFNNTTYVAYPAWVWIGDADPSFYPPPLGGEISLGQDSGHTALSSMSFTAVQITPSTVIIP